MKALKFISLLAMAMIAVPAFATVVGEGSTVVATNAEGNPIVLEAGAEVPAGMSLTCQDENATIVLDNGSKVVITPGASVSINGNEVRILAGEAVLEAKGTLTVRTSLATVKAARGTLGVTVSGQGTTLTSAEGTWRVENNEGQVRALGAGNTMSIGPDNLTAIRQSRPDEVASIGETLAAATPETARSTAIPGAPEESEIQADIPQRDTVMSGESQ